MSYLLELWSETDGFQRQYHHPCEIKLSLTKMSLKRLKMVIGYN